MFCVRLCSILHKKINASIIANTGILTGKDAVKVFLAGAGAVQVVSAIYKKGIHHITTMLEELESWMTNHDYAGIDSFKGQLAKENLADPFAYKRAQYVDILMKSEIFMQYHPKRGELHDENTHDI